MSIRSSPLLGYNNNVRHRGKVFHIQTEDSGVKYGHIMTHLFTDGGRILKSVKTSYAEYATSERMTEIVREMMKQQHKAMFIALRDGKFEAITEGAGDPRTSRMLAPEGGPQQPVQSVSDAKRPPGVPPPLPRARASQVEPAHVIAPDAGAELPLTMREPEELTLDVEGLERVVEAADMTSPAQRTASELPPPPANLFREKTVAPPPPSSVVSPPLPVRRSSSTGLTTSVAERRYAPTRPASIFGQARPQQGKSIFGEDLMSDKSLDEVILSYLADDLESEKK
jgi:hypothetical protein